MSIFDPFHVVVEFVADTFGFMFSILRVNDLIGEQPHISHFFALK
jgi:hypothetical protein